MNENLKDAVDHWLQGQVNTCVAGLISRIERLETTVAGLQRRGEKPKRSACVGGCMKVSELTGDALDWMVANRQFC